MNTDTRWFIRHYEDRIGFKYVGLYLTTDNPSLFRNAYDACFDMGHIDSSLSFCPSDYHRSTGYRNWTLWASLPDDVNINELIMRGLR